MEESCHQLLDASSDKLFLPGGLYQTWTAASASPIQASGRITTILDQDIEDSIELIVPYLLGMLLVNAKKEANEVTLNEGKRRLKEKLLTIRNAQLDKMIQNITSFAYYTEQDDIDQDSTLVAKIWKYLENHYNIATKGAKFLKITNLSYKSGMLPATFYKEYRAGFLDNLHKKGCAEGKLPLENVQTQNITQI